MSAAKQAGRNRERQAVCCVEEVNAPRVKLQRCHERRSPLTTFAGAPGVIPLDDWYRTWVTGRTFILRRTSKRFKEVVYKMHLPVIV